MSGCETPRRSANAEPPTIPQIQVMPPPTAHKPRRRVPRDTGFPEPLDEDRNTTLPHPEANLSPNAIISPDMAAERALKRHRLFFLNKNKRTISHGTISPQMEALQGVLSLSLMDTHSSANKDRLKLISPSASTLRLSKDGDESMRSKRDGREGQGEGQGEGEGDEEYTPPTSPDVSEHRRRKSLLRRLRRKS